MTKFKLWKKWFWVGIIVGFLNALAGVIYGVALIYEDSHQKEGRIIVVWSVVWGTVVFLLALWMRSSWGYHY